MDFSIAEQIAEKFGWLKLRQEVSSYSLNTFKSDLWAGALVAAIAIPSVMAFAMLARFNPVYGIYSFVIAGIAATFVGVSAYAIVGPTSVVALMISSALGTLAITGPEKLGAVLLLTLMVGVIQIILSFFDFGKLANYISRSVIVGLITGVAVIIAVGQLTRILGVEQIHEGNVISYLYQIGVNIGSINLAPLFIALATIIVVLIGKEVLTKAPAYLLAIGTSVGLVYLFGLEAEVQLVGDFQGVFPGFNFPTLNLSLARKFLSYSFTIAMLGFLEVVTVSEFDSKGAVDEEDINKEYLRLGVANVACSLFGGFAGGESFTRSFINHEAGAKSRFSQLIAVIFVLIFMVFFGWIIKYFPFASLGAILILIAFEMVDWEEIKKIVTATRFDTLIFFVTFFTVILVPRLDYAVYLGILFSLLLLVKDSSNVNYSYLKIEDEEIDQMQPSKLEEKDQVIMDLSGDLHFAATEDLRKKLEEAIQKEKVLIIRMRNVDDIDMTVIEELEEVINKAKQRDVQVFFTGLSSVLQRKFKKAGLIEKLGQDHFFTREKELFKASKEAIKKAEEDS
ncbi:MAG: SulP family inorganic anion transporter [Candidatus Paceibacterota bacterium]